MRLITRLREDQRGSALITAILATALMLALGTALLSIVDTEASQSAGERTRDRAFNLAESVLNSEAFVLGRSWPETSPTPNPVTCSVGGAGFGDTLGSTSPTPTAATARLKPNLDASYTDSAYAGATWQVNICDNTSGSNVWSSSLLGNPGWDSNGDKEVWVHAQATVGGLTRVVVGLVQTRTTNPLSSKFGLVSGAMSDDLSSTTAAITNATVLSGLKNGLINTYPPVAPDPVHSVPVGTSGVTGVRCGLLSQVTQLKTCVTGALGALSSLPLFDALVSGGSYAQFPTLTSTSADSIGQLRTQAKSSGVYMATAPGATPTSSTDDSNIPSCGITGDTPNSVVFIEKVGNGDQYCAIDVGAGGVTYKALVIGSGRVVIRGNNTITTYTGVGNPVNQFTGVVYALNLQTSDQTVSTPTKELVRIEKGARVKGAVYSDGKNATVGLIAPDFDVNALVNGLLCPGLTCGVATTLTGLLGTLGVSGIVNALINGQCLVTLPLLGCTVSLPGLGATAVLNGITAQLTTYGSAIHSDVATVNKLTVYGASGVVGGTFQELLSH